MVGNIEIIHRISNAFLNWTISININILFWWGSRQRSEISWLLDTLILSGNLQSKKNKNKNKIVVNHAYIKCDFVFFLGKLIIGTIRKIWFDFCAINSRNVFDSKRGHAFSNRDIATWPQNASFEASSPKLL